MSYPYTYTIPESNPPTTIQEIKIKTSAAKAGWICIGLGILTFWTGIGLMFFSVAIILGIVAMCTFQIREGIAILISAVGSVILIFLLTVLIFGNIFSAAAKAVEEYKATPSSFKFSDPSAQEGR
jgi:hypothetical protein